MVMPSADVLPGPNEQVLAVTLCNFAASWAAYTLLTELPSYLKDNKFDLNEAGAWSDVPVLGPLVIAATDPLSRSTTPLLPSLGQPIHTAAAAVHKDEYVRRRGRLIISHAIPTHLMMRRARHLPVTAPQ
jgi:hypothetical protein